ncbi:MAG TPA: hypothetical protein VFS70_21205, partial [Actinomycetota bacterium]|nr:hypothetical protein [Actinomycetota bacterium]
MEAIPDRGGRWRRWAPYGLLLGAPVAAILVQALAPAPHGHWSSHLGSAAMSAAQLVVLVAAAVALAA